MLTLVVWMKWDYKVSDQRLTCVETLHAPLLYITPLFLKQTTKGILGYSTLRNPVCSLTI